MNNSKNILIGVVVIALIASVHYFGAVLKNEPSPTTGTQTQPVATEASVSLKSKCATDGMIFFEKYKNENNLSNSKGYLPEWENPKFHFNTRLNTCVVFISWTQKSDEQTSGSITTSDWAMTTYVGLYAVIFDIYSNQALLQGVSNRTIHSNGNHEDAVSDHPIYPNVPNLNVVEFNKQSQVLLSE